MIRSLWELSKVQAGFDAHNVLTMSVPLPRNRFPSPAGEIHFFEDALNRIRALPGIESAGVIDDQPLNGGGSNQPFTIEGRSEEHTSELQSPVHLVCRLLLEKKNNNRQSYIHSAALE